MTKSVRSGHKPVPQQPGGPSLTRQSGSQQLENSAIWARYMQTGSLDFWNRHTPRYGDFFDVPSYHEALNRVADFQERFEALPAEVRAACKNDPAELLAMVTDPARHAELRALGLVPPGENLPEPGAPATTGQAEPKDGSA